MRAARRHALRTSVLGVAALVASAVPLACGSSRSTSLSPNSADSAFVATLIPHHHLGMTLVDEATLRSHDVRLRRMVFEMSGYHGSELELLEGWADEWEVQQAVAFPGEVLAADVDRLDTLSGIGHDTWWLRLMIDHHEGAVEIAENQRADGRLAEVQALAEQVYRVQSAEIVAMQALLDELCAELPMGPGCP